MEKQKIDYAIGGQAVIEGVMMKSPSFIAVAVRKKGGHIKFMEAKFVSLTARYKVLKLPIIRGIINLFEMIVMGVKALNFSAEEFAQEELPSEKKEQSKFFDIATIVFSFIFSFALALFLFKFIPLTITEFLRSRFPYIAAHYVIFNLIDGLIRISIFVLYIFILSFFKSFHRIFEYHGAEHMAVHTYEKNHELSVENVARENPAHPRCGTSFLLAVFIVSIIVYSIIPRNPVFWLNLATRIAVIPLIAGIGYEILKWSARHRTHPLIKLVTIPGLLTQKITTQYPSEDQIEVAIAALKRTLELEKNTVIASKQSERGDLD